MIDKKLLAELQEYVEGHLKNNNIHYYNSMIFLEKNVCEEIQSIELEDFIKTNRKQSFNQILFSFIDKKGISDSEIYKKAGIDRRHFSKIRSHTDYHSGKNTVVALALALELNKQETSKLLSAAGYSLSDSDTFDLVIEFCIDKKIYDIQNVNQALDYFSLRPLTGTLE